jgi:hypothetical protein
MTRRRVPKSVLTWLACGGILWANAGCRHSDGPERIAVFGTVTSASGDPVEGTISFLPNAGTKGPAATVSLTDGTFQFDTQNGPVAGQYRVLVVVHLPDQKHKGAPERETPAAAQPDDRPAAEWSFAAEVAPDKVEFDFEVSDATRSLRDG